MTATYTVYRTGDSSTAVSGLPLAEAAEMLLTADSSTYEVRPDDDGAGYRLWLSRIDGRLVPSRFFSVAANRAAAEAEIFGQVVVTDDWHGYETMADDDFRTMIDAAREGE